MKAGRWALFLEISWADASFLLSRRSTVNDFIYTFSGAVSASRSLFKGIVVVVVKVVVGCCSRGKQFTNRSFFW